MYVWPSRMTQPPPLEEKGQVKCKQMTCSFPERILADFIMPETQQPTIVIWLSTVLTF